METPPGPRSKTASRRRISRAERDSRGRAVAQDYDGIAHRRDLRRVGIGRDDVRGEVEAGRWLTLEKHTVVIVREAWSRRSAWWRAIWESGAGAVLDGVAALHASGLENFTHDVVDIALPTNNRRHPVEGVRLRHYRKMPPVIGGGVPRVAPAHALINAARWASTDRIAALLFCLAVQQRIVRPADLLEAFAAQTRCRRRAFIAGVIQDICDGAHSLSELDFAGLCRDYGLPPPSRQVLRHKERGTAILDVCWDDIGLVIEIDGGHHFAALNPVLDALRQNEVVIEGEAVLRIPRLGLRIAEAEFMSQVVRAYSTWSRRAKDTSTSG